MTSLGRLIFFDQPGTGASDPVTPGALPTLEQWADSITAVLDDLGSSEAVLLASVGAFPHGGAVRSDTSRLAPPRSWCSKATQIADAPMISITEEFFAGIVATWGTGESQHVDQSGHAVERGDPGNVGPA